MYRFLFLSLLFVSGEVIAAGSASGHAPSVLDLKYPFLNFVLLFGFMFWKLKGPMNNMFIEKAKTIKNSFELAEEQDKEANLKYEMFAKKMEHINNEVDGIIKNADIDADNFASEQETETQSLITKLEKDADIKVEHEKNVLMSELNNILVNSVISQAKGKIAGDSSLKGKAAKKLVSQIS